MNWAVIKEPTILMTAAVYGLLAALALSAGIFGIWLGVLLFISLWRYCYAVLRATAQGRKRIPPPDLDSISPVGEWSVFWHFVAFPGLVIATLPYQPVGLAIAVLAAIAFPASVALMGLSSSLAQAFTPSAMVGFAKTVGSDYWMLVISCLLMVSGALLVVNVIVVALGIFVQVLTLAIDLWVLLSLFALIGSVLRAHRTEFEIAGEVVPREEEAIRLRHQDWQKVLDIAYGAFRSGLQSAGYKTLHELVDANNDSLEVNHWLVENMLDWQDKQYALEVAARLMPRLLARGDGAGALELYHRCRRRDVNFRLPPAEADRLAEYAATVGHTGVVAELGYNRELL
jgi:hypothetical protein